MSFIPVNFKLCFIRIDQKALFCYSNLMVFLSFALGHCNGVLEIRFNKPEISFTVCLINQTASITKIAWRRARAYLRSGTTVCHEIACKQERGGEGRGGGRGGEGRGKKGEKEEFI